MEIQGLLLAIGPQKIVDVLLNSVGSKYEVVGTIRNNDSVERGIEQYNPDVLMIQDGLDATINVDTVDLLVKLRQRYPRLRIIFLAGEVDNNDTYGINRLGVLVENGIYDIYHSKTISKKTLLGLLNNPKTKTDVDYLLRFKDHKGDTRFEYEDYGEHGSDDTTVSQGYANISIFTSIKPGSGKSFVSTNVGTAIAKWGMRKSNGNYPKVAIIEGDLQTLSVGTLLQLDDKEKNLKNALRAVATVIDDDGNVIGSDQDIEKVKRYVRNCFLKCYQVDNLYALVGSQLSLSDLNEINPYQYYFMIELVADMFDVIIVDTNSSLEHKTTGPLLDLARNCYYILDLDYNNIANNIRYRQALNKLGVMDKVHYILNKDIPDSMQEKYAEKLEYTAKNLHESGFELSAKIPMIDTTVVYNRARQGTPLILDKKPVTIDARKEIFRVASEIYPVNFIEDLREEINQYKDVPEGNAPTKKEKKKFKLFGKKK